MEVHFGHLFGRFRLNIDGELVRLPCSPQKTTGFEGPSLLNAAREFIEHIRTMSDDTEKCRHIGLALNNRPGELLEAAVAALTPAKLT